jgi:excisionase family DNA binding protein
VPEAEPGKRGIMKKICIVRRRRPIEESAISPREESAHRAHSPLLSIELTPQQTQTIRSNTHFQHLYPGTVAPIVFNLHFNDGFFQKMFKAGEICRALQVSRHTLDRLVKTGQVRSYRVGRLRRFTAEDVMDYLANGLCVGELRSVHVDVVRRSEREFETSLK